MTNILKNLETLAAMREGPQTVNALMLKRYGHSPYKVGESLKFRDGIDPFVAKIAKIDGVLDYRLQVVGIPQERPWMVRVAAGGAQLEIHWKYLETV